MTPSREVCVALLARTRSSHDDAENRCSMRTRAPTRRALYTLIWALMWKSGSSVRYVSPVRRSRSSRFRSDSRCRWAWGRTAPFEGPDVPEVKWIAPTSEGATDAASRVSSA